MRNFPATMATQHPDNAGAPYWEKDGSGFVSVYKEIDECLSALRDLKAEEFMWDWEGKFADEAVIDKLFSQNYEFFKNFALGHHKYLTFRLPNVWQEKGYSLIRALMVILTSEDFAEDLKFHSPPLFEVILPMTEKASQLIYIQKSFKELAEFKNKTFSHRKKTNNNYIEIIPLLEGVENQMSIYDLLKDYWKLHKKTFGKSPAHLRPFLARSDPAMASGLCATVLANKVSLSQIYQFGKRYKVPMHPIIGVGSLPFRGGLNPLRLKLFMEEYSGVRTVTLQSAFRYDFPLPQVKKAIKYLNANLSKQDAKMIDAGEEKKLKTIVKKFARIYQATLKGILPEVRNIFDCVPKRRERRQHIGFLNYQRHIGKTALPRAISFTAAFYSLGVPPELLGTGQALAQLSPAETLLLHKYYKHFLDDIKFAGVAR